MRLVALVCLLASACTDYDAASGACARDEDCRDGARCVVGTGVCVRFRNPLDAAMPEPPDLAGLDANASDLAPTD